MGITRFADVLGRTQQQANQFAGPNPVKGIGPKIARLIEEKFDLESGYLDRMPEKKSILDQPAQSAGESILKAGMAAEAYSLAQKAWLSAKSEMDMMVRTALRDLLFEMGINIQNEDNGSFFVSSGQGVTELKLFTPLPGFSAWRPKDALGKLPDFLIVPQAETGQVKFYVMPEESFLPLLQNHRFSISFNMVEKTANGSNIKPYLDDFSAL
ncbi:hypothetical protein [Endozoicomonas arenosclerae]|uniref:hypothetical protein n=1 Tax=Endozoicomonas arenosclerae TaxID=1633495 RepID=UPI0012947C4D|nr:hypothetical protein [Endozoicomonas arenosclerae]